MNPKRFLYGLGLLVLIQVAVNLLLLYLITPLRAHLWFVILTILVMTLFGASLYAAAQIVVRSTLTRLFIQLIMIAVFIKIFLCLALIVVYTKGFNPPDRSFVWSFLFIYITSTIYEVVFLEKVGRQKNTPVS